MIFETAGTPAGDLRGTVQQVIADLVEVNQWLPGVTVEEAARAAMILDRLSEETAEAAAMVGRCPPGRRGRPGIRSPLPPRWPPPPGTSLTSPPG